MRCTSDSAFKEGGPEKEGETEAICAYEFWAEGEGEHAPAGLTGAGAESKGRGGGRSIRGRPHDVSTGR